MSNAASRIIAPAVPRLSTRYPEAELRRTQDDWFQAFQEWKERRLAG